MTTSGNRFSRAEPGALESASRLAKVREIVVEESGLAVVSTIRDDGTVQASVVNAGVVDHPLTACPSVGFVVRGRRRKLANLRARPRATIVFRSGWEWVAVEGDVEIAGPDDTIVGFDSSEVPRLLREIYAAAVGGGVADWFGMDEQMADEGHSAVLMRIDRIYSNPTE